MKHSSRVIGQQNEGLAADYLRDRGYSIITLNWRCAIGEIDIIAQQAETIVFVEVRSRSSSTTAAAFESIDPRKRDKLIRLAHEYLSQTEQEEADWRVDVIGIALQRRGQPMIDHVENALDW